MSHNQGKGSQREIKADGTFKRQASLFSNRFGSERDQLPVQANTYRLIWSKPCPWSHRAVIVRKILGLEDAISLGEVNPIRPNLSRIDWDFSLDTDGVDPVLGITYLSDVYKHTDPDYDGRPTVPAVVDISSKHVVNNDYFTLTNDLETVWEPFHHENAPNLYPDHLQTEIDAFNDVIYHAINNGVYQCGFAHSQKAYEQAYDRLFTQLETIERHLATNRFLLGDYITDADVRLYVTLVRFDSAYYTVFKANKKRLIDYPHLWGYARDLYETPGFGDTTYFEAIKEHYYVSAYLSAADKPSHVIIPKGPDLSGWTSDSNRQHLSESKEKFLTSNH